MAMNLALPLRDGRPSQCRRRRADVIAHGAGEVRLVGEAERGGDIGQTAASSIR
jgi:hypothetical protein